MCLMGILVILKRQVRVNVVAMAWLRGVIVRKNLLIYFVQMDHLCLAGVISWRHLWICNKEQTPRSSS